MPKNGSVAVEVDGPKNECILFKPLWRKVRGRLDVHRMLPHDKDAAGLLDRFPDPVPGQRIGLEPAKQLGFLEEPLHGPEHEKTRDAIDAKGLRLPQEREEFPDIHVPTWMFYIKDAVEAGLARVIAGELPDTIEGEPQKIHMVHRHEDPTAKFTQAIEEQTAAIKELLLELARRQ